MAVWYLDTGIHLDQEDSQHIECEVEFDVDYSLLHEPFSDDQAVEVNIEFDVDVIHTLPLDLLPLVPEKFRSSPILQAYLTTAGIHFSSFLNSIKSIVLLLGPNTVSSATYLRHLGALIGVVFPPEDESTVGEIRKTLSDAVDWYKMKGTYRSVDIIALIQSYTVNLYDMYTDDYVSFVLTDWFVGDENENPPGLDSSYYKSPHFGAEVVLNQVYTPSGTSLRYLWQSAYLGNFLAQIEETRPVHTVPHFLLLLNPKTDEFGHIIQTDGETKAKVTSSWTYGAKYFDIIGSGDAWAFDDDSMTFDTSAEAFIKSITTWVLGTGNYPCHLSDSSLAIEAPALTGTIDTDDITITDEYFQFEFIVPKSEVQSGLSELGLYIPGSPDTLVLASCFPKVDKTSDVELRVVVQVFKKDLTV